MYVQVILPLKLGWTPTYDAGALQLVPGDRVRVKLAGREYVGVVSRSGVTPDIDPKRILPVLGKEEALEPILPGELEFWDFISEYYMCSPGEVYKYVYPASRTKVEEKKARTKTAALLAGKADASGKDPRSTRKAPGATSSPRETADRRPRLDSEAKKAVTKILASFDDGKPALLVKSTNGSLAWAGASSIQQAGETGMIATVQGGISIAARSEAIEAELTRRTLEQNRDVLVIDPEAPRESYVALRDAAAAARDTACPAKIYHGSKALLFLPFTRLGLIIVRDEQSEKHKQGSMAPRFHARDAALMLGRQCCAAVLLTSPSPSLESIWNCRSGKYTLVAGSPEETPKDADSSAATPDRTGAELIDTSAELRKNGMVGSFSRKLLSEMAAALEKKQHVALIVPWKNGNDIEIEAREHFPGARTLLSVMPLHELKKPEKYALAALLRADYLLGRPDFRCDEKALRILQELEAAFPRLIVQTSDTGYKILSERNIDAILEERRNFGYPPFTRIVDISLSDTNEARRAKLSAELSRILGTPAFGDTIRIILKRDRELARRKKEILRQVEDFEKSRKYYSHIKIDVDPV